MPFVLTLSRVALCTAALTLHTASAIAQAPATPAASASAAAPAEEALALDKLTVSNTRSSEYIAPRSTGTALFGGGDTREVPFSLAIVPRALIDNTQARNLSEALLTDPSLTNSYGGSGGYPTESFNVRGFELGGGDSILKDGSPMGGQVTQGLENVEQVELLKGPAAFRYGFLPPGGVLNLTTKRPTETASTRLTTGVDQWGGYKAHLDTGGPLGTRAKLGYRINLSHENAQNFVDEIFNHRYFVGAVLAARPTDATAVTLTFDRNESAILGDMFHYTKPDVNGNEITGLKPRDYWGQQWADWDSVYTNAALKLEHNLNEAWSLDSTTAYFAQKQESQLTIANNVRPDGDFDTQESRGRFAGRMWSHTTFTVGEFDTGALAHRLVAGFNARKRDSESPRTPGGATNIGTNNFYRPRPLAPSGLVPGPLVLSLMQKQLGLFVSDQVTVAERWRVLGGLRYSEFADKRFNALTGATTRDQRNTYLVPTAALLFDASQRLSWYASFARGVEPGGVAPAGTVNQFQVQDPLESEQFETGVRSSFLDGKLLVDGALFTITKASEYTDPALNRYVQNGDQEHTGGEITVRGELSKNLQLVLGAQYLDATLKKTGNAQTEGDRPYNVPDWHFTSYVDYGVPAVSGLHLVGGVYYVGEREVTVPNVAAKGHAYTRVDLGARYETKLAGRAFTIRLNVENVLDETYYVAAWANLFEFGAPTTARLSAELTF